MIISSSARILAALYSNKRPGEIAAGAALAVWAALIPGSSLLFWLVFLLIFFVKVNQAIALLVLALTLPVAPLLDPLLHRLGSAILTAESLYPLWSGLAPWAAFTRFNNTVVMGGLTAGILAFPLVFLGIRALIIPIRTRLVPGIASSKLAKRLYTSPKVVKLVRSMQKWNSFYQTIGG